MEMYGHWCGEIFTPHLAKGSLHFAGFGTFAHLTLHFHLQIPQPLEIVVSKENCYMHLSSAHCRASQAPIAFTTRFLLHQKLPQALIAICTFRSNLLEWAVVF